MAKKLAIIASKGTLDGAYPPFLLASTAAALGFEAKIFYLLWFTTAQKRLVIKSLAIG